MSTTELAQIYNFRSVDDKLATAGQPTETQLAAVAGAGFQAVINLALHNDPRYSLPDEPGAVRALGMEYVHIPVRFSAPSESDLMAFFTAMDSHQHQKVLIHCAANKRVTAFLGLYRAIKQGWPRQQAFALMDAVWTPDSVWSTFIEAMLSKHGGAGT